MHTGLLNYKIEKLAMRDSLLPEDPFLGPVKQGFRNDIALQIGTVL